ncbi:MAG: serine hydrolase [Phycisphaerales bacterium]
MNRSHHPETPSRGLRANKGTLTLIAAAIAALATSLAPAYAQDTSTTNPPEAPDEAIQPATPAQLPDAPVAERANWLITLVSEGPEAIPAPWPLVFAPGVLDQLPLTALEEWAAPKREGWGKLIPIGWSFGSDNGNELDSVLIILLQAEADGSGWRLSVAVDPEPPHLILAWQIEPDLSATRPRHYESVDEIKADLDRAGFDYGLALYDVTDHTPEARGEPVEVLSINADTPLNISTAIRWIILGAAAERVRSSMLVWNEPMALDPAFYSMPPGNVRSVPPGEELPVSTVIGAMMTGADNTATDQLINRLGPEVIDEYLTRRTANPAANQPFLTTMQLFRLKVGASEDPITQYAQAQTPEQRRAILESGVVDTNQIAEQLYLRWAVPQYVDTVGWFFTADELAQIMAEIRRRSLFPGMEIVDRALRSGAESPVPQDDRWDAIVARIDGEPGVISIYSFLERADGRVFLLAMVANNPEQAVNTALISPVLDAMLDFLAPMEPADYPAARLP